MPRVSFIPCFSSFTCQIPIITKYIIPCISSLYCCVSNSLHLFYLKACTDWNISQKKQKHWPHQCHATAWKSFPLSATFSTQKTFWSSEFSVFSLDGVAMHAYIQIIMCCIIIQNFSVAVSIPHGTHRPWSGLGLAWRGKFDGRKLYSFLSGFTILASLTFICLYSNSFSQLVKSHPRKKIRFLSIQGARLG